ncbi:MAG: pentapeptide repeat-containing protein [Spirochaetales bacterium]|nr:pentapeptide repeat-containing protein [Spirochaetales bacterium]
MVNPSERGTTIVSVAAMIIMKKMKRRLKLFMKKKLKFIAGTMPQKVAEGFRTIFNTPFRYALVLCSFAVFILVVFDVRYFWDSRGIDWIRVIAGAHGVFFDVLVFALVVLAIDLLRERRKKIYNCRELLKDFCFWDDREGILRKSGIIRQLSDLGAGVPAIRGLNLHGADLRNLKLNKSRFIGCDLSGADLSNTELNHSRFIVVFENNQDRDSDYSSIRFDGAILARTSFCDARLDNIDFSSLDMRRIRFSRSHLKDAVFMGACLHFADFCDCDLQGALFLHADLYRARFKRANLCGAQLSKGKQESWENGFCARCPHANFERAVLNNAGLAWVDLSYANMAHAHFVRARMDHCNLSRARLDGSIFVDADLRSADFFLATLDDADLSRANLKGARHLTVDQLKHVKTLYQASLDDELVREITASNLGRLLTYPDNNTRR